MTLQEVITAIELVEPRLCWIIRTKDNYYFANVHEDVNLNQIAYDKGISSIDKLRSISYAPKPELALSEAFAGMMQKRANKVKEMKHV